MQAQMAQRPLHKYSLSTLCLIGGIIAFMLISVYLLMVGEPSPDFPRFWKLRPLAVFTFAGVMSGVVYYFMDYIRIRGGWIRIVANIMCGIIIFVGMWMGFVLGLVGTLWH